MVEGVHSGGGGTSGVSGQDLGVTTDWYLLCLFLVKSICPLSEPSLQFSKWGYLHASLGGDAHKNSAQSLTW